MLTAEKQQPSDVDLQQVEEMSPQKLQAKPAENQEEEEKVEQANPAAEQQEEEKLEQVNPAEPIEEEDKFEKNEKTEKTNMSRMESSSVLLDLLRDHNSEIGNWCEIVNENQDMPMATIESFKSQHTIDEDGPFYIFASNLNLNFRNQQPNQRPPTSFDLTEQIFQHFGGKENLFTVFIYQPWTKGCCMFSARDFEACIRVLQKDGEQFRDKQFMLEYVLSNMNPMKYTRFDNAQLDAQLQMYRLAHPPPPEIPKLKPTTPFGDAKPVDTLKIILKVDNKMREEINSTHRSSQITNLSAATTPLPAAADQQNQQPPKVLDRNHHHHQTSQQQQQPPRSIFQHSDSHGSGGGGHGSGRVYYPSTKHNNRDRDGNYNKQMGPRDKNERSPAQHQQRHQPTQPQFDKQPPESPQQQIVVSEKRDEKMSTTTENNSNDGRGGGRGSNRPSQHSTSNNSIDGGGNNSSRRGGNYPPRSHHPESHHSAKRIFTKFVQAAHQTNNNDGNLPRNNNYSGGGGGRGERRQQQSNTDRNHTTSNQQLPRNIHRQNSQGSGRNVVSHHSDSHGSGGGGGGQRVYNYTKEYNHRMSAKDRGNTGGNERPQHQQRHQPQFEKQSPQQQIAVNEKRDDKMSTTTENNSNDGRGGLGGEGRKEEQQPKPLAEGVDITPQSSVCNNANAAAGSGVGCEGSSKKKPKKNKGKKGGGKNQDQRKTNGSIWLSGECTTTRRCLVKII